MTTSNPPPEASDDEPIKSAPKARTRRSLIGLGGIIAGVVIGTAFTGTRANAIPPPICFLCGTMIQTPTGQRSIESLTIGDTVTTVSGAARPVKWIGRMSFVRAAGRREWVRDVTPVRIARGAIDGALPRRDLFVSQAHALHIDGVLVPASDLVGAPGITIESPATADRLDYFHIELDSHDAVYAEGLPAETYRENGDRERFDNFIEYERRYGRSAGEQKPFAPLVGYGSPRNRARSHLRSALSPWIDRRTTFDRIRDRLMERSPS